MEKQFLEERRFKFREQSTEERECGDFAEGLREIFSELDKLNLDWHLVGGMALNGFAELPINPRRPNGTIRDVDLMILSDNPEEFKKLQKFFDKRQTSVKANRIYPEVNLSPIKSEEYLKNERKTAKLLEIVPQILFLNNRYYLCFRDVKEELDPAVFSSRETTLNIGGDRIQAKTFPIETIIHLYLTRAGYVKSKDIEKLRDILKMTRGKNLSTEGHKPYSPFHRFAKRIRERYQITTKAFQLYNYVDHKLFHSAISHKVIPKKILNFLLTA